MEGGGDKRQAPFVLIMAMVTRIALGHLNISFSDHRGPMPTKLGGPRGT